MANTNKMIFAMVAGILYVVFGILKMLEGFGIETGLAGSLLIPGDFFGGFCFVVIGAVFLYAGKELSAGVHMGVSYVYVGILMSLVFMAVYLLVMGSDILMFYVVKSEDYEGWRIIDSMRPGIYLGLLSLIGYFFWKDRFTTEMTKA
ncbi:hypothetical protein [Methanococcoides sp. NM1]|uniref:hypothetical protein n=1 Tax=Methanococcoides sp. NM1 TaxID=1201013 RepID=UPI001082EC77|nr:hypothetical protein [Methanococcoides sp. NM1]